MRSAGQDWYEQGDVWARVAEHRNPAIEPRGASPHSLIASVTRLISVDCFSHAHPGTALAHTADWAAAYDAAGRELAELSATGLLHRGLRDVLAHHIIFAWNRLGLPYIAQARLAAAARTAVFGPDPAHTSQGTTA
jgi:thiopeptide-type bacteriocin biosynthesis protein